MGRAPQLFQTSLSNSQKRGNGIEFKPQENYLDCCSSPSPSADFHVMDYSHLSSVGLQDISEPQSHLVQKAKTPEEFFSLDFNLFSEKKSINSSW